MRLTSVVLPAPRNPVCTVTGMRAVITHLEALQPEHVLLEYAAASTAAPSRTEAAAARAAAAPRQRRLPPRRGAAAHCAPAVPAAAADCRYESAVVRLRSRARWSMRARRPSGSPWRREDRPAVATRGRH